MNALKKQVLSLANNVASTTLLSIQKYSLAVRAAQLNSRPPIVSAIADIPLAKAREIYREVTGRQPIKGQLPSDNTFYISEVNCHLESVWLVQAYRLFAKPTDDVYTQRECLFVAYEMYQSKFPKQAISFDRFFYLIRLTFTSDEISLTYCNKCSSAKLLVKTWDPNKIVKCPICHLSAYG